MYCRRLWPQLPIPLGIMMVQQTLRRSSVTDGQQSAVVGLGLFLSEVAALCFPAIVNQGPIVFPDTRAYYLGGWTALEKARALIEWHASGASAASVDVSVQKARGVRSVFYSLFTYLMTDLSSLWLVVALQAVIVALALRLTFNLLCPQQPRWRGTLFIILVAIATTASWTVSMVMPDVFTPVVVLCVILAMLFWQRLSLGTRWALVAAITAGVVMHLTNLPIALGVLAAGILLRRKLLRFEWSRYLAVTGGLGAGVVAMLAVGVVGFGQWTLSPQAPPFLLARSIADGPGKLYLQDHCPQIGLTMCRHLAHPIQRAEVYFIS